MPRPRIVATLFLACSVLMGAGTGVAFALPESASPASTVAAAPAAPAGPAIVGSAADTARAAKLLGLTPPAQVAFVPVCYYVYRYAYVCSGGRCAYVYRYVYVCN